MSAPTTSIKFSGSAPAAPAGNQNVIPQSDGGTPQQSVSFYPQQATALALGVVKPDGITTTVAADGTLTSVAAVDYESGEATAGSNQNQVVFGSIPIPGSVDLYQYGVLVSPDLYFVSGNIATLLSNVFATGADVVATWATNGAAGSGIELTSGQLTAPVLRGSSSAIAYNVATVTVPLPASAVAGDFAVLFYAGYAALTAAPSGWTANEISSNTGWNGATLSKALISTDITAGAVTLTSTGEYSLAGCMAVFVSGTGGIREVDVNVQNASYDFGTEGPTVSTSTSVAPSDYLLIFGSTYGDNYDSISNTGMAASINGHEIVPLQHQDTNEYAECSVVMGGGAVSAGGAQTGAFGGQGHGAYLAAVPVKAATPATGSYPPLPTGTTASGGGSADATEIQGIPVSTTAPTTGQVLEYNGTEWTPGTGGGDVVADAANTFSTGPQTVITGTDTTVGVVVQGTGTGYNTPTHVQTAYDTGRGVVPSSGTMTVTAGNTLLYWLANANNGQTSHTVTDTQGNTWTLVGSIEVAGQGTSQTLFLYMATDIVGGAITINATNSSGGVGGLVQEFSGLSGNVIAMTSSTSASAGTSFSAGPVEATGESLVVAGFTEAPSGVPGVAASGFSTPDVATTYTGVVAAYQVATGASSYTANWTQTGSAGWWGGLIVILEASISGGQEADLLQFKDADGNFLSSVNNKGQFVLPTTSGAPTNTPSGPAMAFDESTGKLWIFNGTAWKSVTLS
jgi:hypothetical protein